MTIEVVQAKLDGIRRQLADIQQVIDSASSDFEAVIKDKSIPLVDRWELFCKAPESLKEHDQWCSSFDVLEQYGISFYDDLYIERYQTTNTVDLIDQVLHGSKLKKCLIGTDISIQELADILKEEILQDNLGSFRFDW